MAVDPKQIAQLKKDLKELNALRDKLGEKPIEVNFEELNLDGVKQLTSLLEKARVAAFDLEDGFGGISRSIKNIVNEWKPGFVDPARDATKSFTKLKGIAEKLSDDITNITVLNKKQLQQSIEQIKSEKNRLNNLKEELKIRAKAGEALSEAEAALLANLESEYDVTEDLLKQANKRLDVEKSIEKTLGVTGGLFKGITKSLEKIGIESEHFEKINEDLREAAKSGNGFKVLGAGIKSVGTSIKSAFSDPLVQVATIGKLLQGVVEYATQFDKETIKIQRDLGLTKNAAAEMNMELGRAAQHIGRTRKDTVQANADLNEFLGTSVMLSEKQLSDQVALTKNAGLEADVRAGIYKFSLLTGETQEQIFDSIGKQNKGVLNNKKVLAEVAKTSGQLAAQYKNNPELIGKAVVQAQKLGMTLEQTKKISQGLLNFEDSISAELEAELLTGQDLNLERARGLALQGDTAGAAAELMKNLGPNGLAKFQKMNVIQQEAYARALGMSADELGDSLVRQKQLNVLNTQDKSELQKKVEALKAEGKEEKAAELERLAIKNKSVSLAEQELDKSEKQAQAAEKLKESFNAFMVGPVTKAMDFFTNTMQAIADSPILKGLVGFVGVGATVAGMLMVGKSIISAFKAPIGSKSNPSYTIVENMGGIGGGEGGGDISDSLGGGQKAGVGKQLKTLFKKPKVLGRALSGKGGGKLLKGLGKGLKGGIGGLIGGLALDAAAEAANESGNKGLGKGLDVTSGALSGAGTGAMIGSIIPGVGTAIGGVLGGLIGGGMSYFGGDEPEMAMGGIVSRPTRAIIGEAGSEAVIPLDKFYAKLDELISVVKSGGNIYLDGTRVGTAMNVSTYKVQ
jgi:hypothetical protein